MPGKPARRGEGIAVDVAYVFDGRYRFLNAMPVGFELYRHPFFIDGDNFFGLIEERADGGRHGRLLHLVIGAVLVIKQHAIMESQIRPVLFDKLTRGSHPIIWVETFVGLGAKPLAKNIFQFGDANNFNNLG
jgi:hypothetical protein